MCSGVDETAAFTRCPFDMHPVTAPADPLSLPGAVAVEPPDLRPIAIARPAPGLTGGRLAMLRALFAFTAVAGALGVAASLATGYQVHESGSGILLESRPAGDALSTTWSMAGLLLGALGLAFAPRRRSGRLAALALLALTAAMLTALFVTFDLDFNLDWDTYTIERWPAQALPASIIILALAGPVLLAVEWILVRLERRRHSSRA